MGEKLTAFDPAEGLTSDEAIAGFMFYLGPGLRQLPESFAVLTGRRRSAPQQQPQVRTEGPAERSSV